MGDSLRSKDVLRGDTLGRRGSCLDRRLVGGAICGKYTRLGDGKCMQGIIGKGNVLWALRDTIISACRGQLEREGEGRDDRLKDLQARLVYCFMQGLSGRH